jgi:hypothetical protein
MRTLTVAELAGEAIAAYVQNMERHGHDPERARAEAISEIAEGAALTEADLSPEPAAFMIWSNQKRMWWAPNEHGYVHFIDAAGVYGADRARKILAVTRIGEQSTIRGSDGRTWIVPNEVLLPLWDEE